MSDKENNPNICNIFSSVNESDSASELEEDSNLVIDEILDFLNLNDSIEMVNSVIEDTNCKKVLQELSDSKV